MIIELAVLLAVAILGASIFAVFEVETPAWRKVLKWGMVTGLTLGVYAIAGHLAVLVLLGLAISGLCVHFWWCRRHGIDPLRATPRRRYYALRGWTWVE